MTTGTASTDLSDVVATARASTTDPQWPNLTDATHLVIDISDRCVRYLAARQHLHTFRLLDTGHFYDGKLLTEATLRSIFKQLLPDDVAGKVRLTLSFSGEKTVIRGLAIPKVPAAEVNKMTRFRAGSLIPFPLEDSRFGYEIVQRPTRKSDDGWKLLLGATLEENIEIPTSIIRERGAEIDRITLTPFGFSSAGEWDQFKQYRTWGFVEMFPDKAIIGFVHDGALEFVHEAPTPSVTTEPEQGSQSDDSLQRMFAQLSHDPGEFRTLPPDEVADKIITEMNTAFDYYAGTCGERTVEHLFLTGFLPHATELTEQLSERMSIPCSKLEIEETNKRLNCERLQKNFCPYSLAVNLLPGAGALNLLPANVIATRRERKANRMTNWIMVALAIMLAVTTVLTIWKIEISQDKIESLEGTFTQLLSSAGYAHLTENQRAMVLLSHQLERFKSQGRDLTSYMRLLSTVSEPGLVLVSTELESDLLVLSGYVEAGEVEPKEKLLRFVRSLESSQLVKQAEVIGYDFAGSENGTGNFEVSCRLQ